MAKRKVLMVKLNDRWKYVFCRNVKQKDPAVTDDPLKALPARAIDYFKQAYSDHEFKEGY